MKKNKLIRKLVTIIILGIFTPQSIFAQKEKVSCVGNSITYGYGLSNPSTQSYPSQLQVLLGTSFWTVGNFGDSGRTMLKSGGYSYWDSSSYTSALASNPNYIMLELGTNDAKTYNWNNHGNEFVSDYKEMIQIFQNLSSKPDVWIGLIPPGQNISWSIPLTIVRDSVNSRIKQIALQSGVGLIDIFDALGGNSSEWYNPTYFQTDSIHPTTAGAAIIAQKVKEMLSMAKPEITFANGKVTVPAGYDYQWYIDGIPAAAENGGTQKEMTVTQPGIYKVSVKLNADNETRIVSKELNVLQTSVSSIYSNKIKVYPNPTFDVIQAQADNIEKKATYTMTDLSGKLLLKGQIQNGRGKINIGKLSKGTYILTIGNKQVKVTKTK
jgi:lysophospholipase L1-like esterase